MDFMDILIISSIFIFGILTIIFSIWSLKLIHKKSSLRNAFGYICAAQSLTEAIIGACFGLWAAPVAAATKSFYPDPLQTVSKSIIGIIVGHIIIFCFYLCIWLHLCKSINRLYAIIFPIHYHSKFTAKAGIILICLMIFISFGFASFAFDNTCNVYFNSEIYLWRPRETKCAILGNLQIFTGCIVVIGCVIFDIITLAYLIMFNKRLQQVQINNKTANEKRFFIQNCLTTVIYVFAMISITVLVKNFPQLYILFVTIVWQLFHLLNQLIFIIFSKKMMKPTPAPSKFLSPVSAFVNTI